MKNIVLKIKRSFLTVCGIAVGVFAVVVISAVGDIGENLVDEKLKSMGMESIIVSSQNGGLQENDVEQLKSMDFVENAMPLMSVTLKQIMPDDNETDRMLWGVDENADEVIELKVVSGRKINAGDLVSHSKVCMIDRDVAEETYGTADITGMKITLGFGNMSEEFEAVGVVDNGVSMLQSSLGGSIPSFVYIPYTTLSDISKRDGFDVIAVKAQANINTEKSIEKKLSDNLRTVEVSNLLTQKKQLTSLMKVVSCSMTAVAGISVIISGISSMTAMMSAVKERTREIGIKKAIGARKTDIISEFLGESLLISVSGGVFGGGLGILTVITGCILFDIDVYINPVSVLSVIIFSTVTGVIFGIVPALKASSLNPVVAIRSH